MPRYINYETFNKNIDRLIKRLVKPFPVPLITFLLLFNFISFSQVKHPSWSYNLSIYEVNIRQYTPEGSFRAFEKHLPRLKEMGAGILWLMPVTPIGELNRKGSLGSYYSVKDYYGINPEFGTLDDFKHLVNEIHKSGMYVIIDWVANHTSWDNPLTKEHPDWYMEDENGGFLAPVADWTDVIDLNYENKELWKYMSDAMQYWLRETDIDGFRCDVAGMIPLDFWNQTRPELEKIKPVFMLAEAEGPEFHEKAFDATYSWSLFRLMISIAKGEKNAQELLKFFKDEKDAYSVSCYRMRFTSNHDENTWNGTEFETFGEAAETFAVLTKIVPGIPLIYNGQEAGSDKRLRFFEKDTILWREHRLTTIYSKLLHLRRENVSLFNGEQGGDLFIPETANKNIFAAVRSKGNQKIMAVFNLSSEPGNFNFKEPSLAGTYSELFSGEELKTEGEISVELKGWDYKVFVLK